MYKKVNASLADRLMFLFFGVIRVEDETSVTRSTPPPPPPGGTDGTYPAYNTSPNPNRDNLLTDYGASSNAPLSAKPKSFKTETSKPELDPAVVFSNLEPVESNLEEVDGKDT